MTAQVLSTWKGVDNVIADHSYPPKVKDAGGARRAGAVSGGVCTKDPFGNCLEKFTGSDDDEGEAHTGE